MTETADKPSKACECALNLNGVISNIEAIRRLKKVPIPILTELKTFIQQTATSCNIDLAEEADRIDEILKVQDEITTPELHAQTALIAERTIEKLAKCEMPT